MPAIKKPEDKKENITPPENKETKEILQSGAVDMEMVKKMMEKIEALTEQNKALFAIADVGRLSRYQQSQNKEDIVLTGHIRFYDGLPVVAWKMQEDEVYRDVNGIHHERQMVKLYFADGKDKVVTYKDSELRVTKKKGEIVKRTRDQITKEETITIRLEDGQEYSLDIKFIN